MHAQLSCYLLGPAQEGVGKKLQALACRSRSLTLFSWLRSDGINQSAFASKVLQRVLEPSRPCVLWPSFELPVRVYRNKQTQTAPWGKQLLPGPHLLRRFSWFPGHLCFRWEQTALTLGDVRTCTWNRSPFQNHVICLSHRTPAP